MIAQDVFTIAMTLMDEISQDGTYAGYPDDYKKKAWPILTLLQAELLGPNATILTVVNDGSTLQVDDRTGTVVLPYGLAAHLLLSENPSVASFLNDRYEELKRKRKAVISPIKDMYGVVDGNTVTTDTTTADTDIIIDGGEV